VDREGYLACFGHRDNSATLNHNASGGLSQKSQPVTETDDFYRKLYLESERLVTDEVTIIFCSKIDFAKPRVLSPVQRQL
jgi:hypothetical protein